MYTQRYSGNDYAINYAKIYTQNDFTEKNGPRHARVGHEICGVWASGEVEAGYDSVKM